MSNTKFTDGEWKKTTQFNVMVGYDPVKPTFVNTQHTGGLMATVKEREANAALIAAAPDMYKALERQREANINLMDLELVPHKYLDGVEREIDLIDEVLAKARGEQ